MNRSTSQEMIELKNLNLEKQLDLTRGLRGTSERPVRLERANALRIAPGKVPEILSRVRQIRLLGGQSDPKLTEELGEGHIFKPCTQNQPTWCDLCGEFIWGMYKKRLQCVHCKFICHYRCRVLIRLDCSGPRYQDSDQNECNEQTVEKDTNVDEQIDWEKPILSQTEIEQKIKEYNGQINSNLFMSLNKDGSYTGFIKVQLKLIRPVSVPANKKAPSIQDTRKSSSRSQAVKRRTSFYLPKDTVKHLHIISRTCASEVIEALLKKFMVVDNPRKFALFERTEKDDQVYLRKLSDEEQPLRLRLLAGPNEKALSFVLKENETGEVNWDAFSMPELQNFLRILQREEEEHVRQILQKYTHCRQKIQEALTTRTPG
ncbi:PREDICTED: ras association domain-containing protein 1 isoform X1 [Gekko japonicus]|uniref:Ras association domain-containing protein 1 isoform X1 n=1 Tax=Gekko japonicus TaxID=146911 RepID=A0ABM1KI05_GEKJA|nr:PREDICTED: ras association domain-containing protein 1 isoform X1 [Gekko japonicus]